MKTGAIQIGLRASCRAGVMLIASCGCAQQHSFDVKDCIAMTRFNQPSGLLNGEKAQRSPDGRFFWIITSKGLIDSNQIQSTLWIIDASAVRRFLNAASNERTSAPVPRAVVRIMAVPRVHVDDPYASVISDVHWSSDSNRIFFLGENSSAEMQLYETNVQTGSLKVLSPPEYGVRQFDVSGDTIAYTALPSDAEMLTASWDRGRRINKDAVSVTGLPLADILFPETALVFGSGKVVPGLWVAEKGKFRRVVDPDQPRPVLDTEHNENVLSLSPDGRMVVRLLPIQSMEKSWRLYAPKVGFESWRIDPQDASYTDPSNLFRLREYELIDAATGKATKLIDGPSGESLAELDRSQAVWSEKGSRLLLTNVALPMQSVDLDEQAKRRHSCAVAAVDLPSLRTICVVFTRDAAPATSQDPQPERLQDASFGGDMDEVVLRFSSNGAQGQTERYKFENGKWNMRERVLDDPATEEPLHSGASDKNVPETLALAVRQDLNDRPKLWAVDTVSGRSKLLWDPNPALDAMRFGKASLYQWEDKSGYKWSGVLILPTDYSAGKRFPLVIQTHGVPHDVFITDGKYSTAMAARPLASAGFVVLQIPYRSDHFASQREPTDQLAGYEGAISQLNTDGLIDSYRVGITGFSRTCWHVESALIRHPGLFIAASIADGVDMSYMQYMLVGEGYPIWAKAFEKIVGVKPIEPNFGLWEDQAATFHLNQLTTPLRIEAVGPMSVLAEWEIYRSLRLQNKPVDMIYFPYGQHVLQTPLDRLASEQGNVDWFRFWLQGYEDSDRAKAPQYLGWRKLRNLRRSE